MRLDDNMRIVREWEDQGVLDFHREEAMHVEIGQGNEAAFTIEQNADPERAKHIRALREQAERNMTWLEGHWGDLLPRARGKFVAIAGQEAFIADTASEAWEWAARVHPDDEGALVRYVRTTLGPRIYAHSR